LGTIDLAYDLFGDELDVPVAAAADRDVAKCQQSLVKAAFKCQATQLKEFNRCKKAGFRAEAIDEAENLAACADEDARGAIEKVCSTASGKVATVIAKACESKGVDLSEGFPGCSTGDPVTLAVCARGAIDCRVCETLNAADRLSRVCGSCP